MRPPSVPKGSMARRSAPSPLSCPTPLFNMDHTHTHIHTHTHDTHIMDKRQRDKWRLQGGSRRGGGNLEDGSKDESAGLTILQSHKPASPPTP